jgi:hypothetical protein
MSEESTNKRELDPKFVALIHALMDLFGALYAYKDPEFAVAQMTENERSKAFDYIRANVKMMAPWFAAFKKAKKQTRR